MEEESRTEGLIAVDAHVHFHPGWQVSSFLDSAASNLARASHEAGEPAEAGAILLAERRGSDDFRRLASELASGRAHPWRILTRGGSLSMLLERPGRLRLLVLAGRQLVTAESLEVLALGLEADIPDGLPLDVCCARTAEAGALPVIPWGLGKWWAARGRKLIDLLSHPPTPWLFVGDSALRPWLGERAPDPAPIAAARLHRVPVLPGSDPLPLAGEAQRVGGYGFLLRCPPEGTTGWAGVRRELRRLTADPPAIGRRLDPLRCLARQVHLRSSTLVPARSA